MLRAGNRAYNEAVGVPNSDTRGYHETVTRSYAWAAARFGAPLAARWIAVLGTAVPLVLVAVQWAAKAGTLGAD